MTRIKSEKAKAFLKDKKVLAEILVSRHPIQHVVGYYAAYKAVKLAETEAEERHAKELQELRDRAVDHANITLGAMILDGYEPEDSCVKYMQELIEELKTLK